MRRHGRPDEKRNISSVLKQRSESNLSAAATMSEVNQAFIAECRSLLVKDYLPKIERSVELLSDEQIWWRANPSSNSIGNLLLHQIGRAHV